MLTFLREQAVSISAHRFGTPRRYEIPTLHRASRKQAYEVHSGAQRAKSDYGS